MYTNMCTEIEIKRKPFATSFKSALKKTIKLFSSRNLLDILGMVFLLYGPTDASSTWSSPQMPYHILHTHALWVHECADASSWQLYLGITCYIPMNYKASVKNDAGENTN